VTGAALVPFIPRDIARRRPVPSRVREWATVCYRHPVLLEDGWTMGTARGFGALFREADAEERLVLLRLLDRIPREDRW